MKGRGQRQVLADLFLVKKTKADIPSTEGRLGATAV
jgi:hypothetical protein